MGGRLRRRMLRLLLLRERGRTVGRLLGLGLDEHEGKGEERSDEWKG